MLELFNWDEKTFLDKTEGTAIRRIGYERWLRNIAVALGNAISNKKPNENIIAALKEKRNHDSAIVKDHIEWALQQQQ